MLVFYLYKLRHEIASDKVKKVHNARKVARETRAVTEI